MKSQNSFGGPFLVVFVIALLICAKSCSDKTPVFTNDWDEDIYYFGKNLEEKHKDVYHQYEKSKFEADLLRLRTHTSEYSESKILFELAKIIAKIGDSHTQLQFGSKVTILPIGINWFDDGIFLTRTDDTNTKYLKKKILRVNEIPIQTVIDSFRTIIAYENESQFKNQFVTYFSFFEFQKEFGFVTDDRLPIQLEGGQEYQVELTVENQTEFTSPTTPLFLSNTEDYYHFVTLPEDKLIYIQYNRCREYKSNSFEKFTFEIETSINSDSEIDKVVLDLRLNGGGNSSIIRPLTTALETYIENDRLRKEDIYVLISRRTFSSAVLNTIELKEKLDATLVGEPTGGAPNHFGEIKSFRLPKSKLNVYYSTKYFSFDGFIGDSIEPDIKIEYTADHYFNGIDPILTYIIAK